MIAGPSSFCHIEAYFVCMDFKAQMASGKAVETLPDGTQQAPFAFDFSLDGKAVETNVDENGDLWIEGYASDFGLDRQDEAFEPGAFERGLKSFLERNPIMLYHHQYDKALGQFVDARVDQKGLWVRGRVDKPAVGSWAEDVFNKVRKGTIKAFSVGGIFRRRQTSQGPRIYDCDLGEISITPFPVNPRTTFAVVARKAFENEEAPAVTETETETVVTEPAAEVVTEVECADCKKRAEEEAARVAEKGAEVETPAAEEEEELTPEALEAVSVGLDESAGPGENEQADLLAASLERLVETLQSRYGDKEEPAAEVEGEKAVPSTSGRALPSLERSLRKNWVERVGGFGVNNWIYRAAKHMVYEKGFEVGAAIATAINAAKKMCATGDTNFPGVQKVNPASRAEACAAVAAWNKMKAEAHAS